MILSIIFFAAVGIWNIVTFVLYGIDKQKAKANKRRISEKILFVSAFCMGGLGAFLGMMCFRHKTQHTSFKILIPLFLILNIIIAVLFLEITGVINIFGVFA